VDHQARERVQEEAYYNVWEQTERGIERRQALDFLEAAVGCQMGVLEGVFGLDSL
jgi:hypothetical protein